MYLQKYGNAIPALFVIMIGSNITATARIINFVYVKNLNFFVLNFLVGIKIYYIRFQQRSLVRRI